VGYFTVRGDNVFIPRKSKLIKVGSYRKTDAYSDQFKTLPEPTTGVEMAPWAKGKVCIVCGEPCAFYYMSKDTTQTGFYCRTHGLAKKLGSHV